MKRILTSLVLVASVYSFAQVSISGEADDTPQATLDVKAIGGKTNGILVPRVTKEEADDMPSPQAGDIEESTLIYITGDVSKAGTKYATEVKTNGFYYFKGGKWVKLGSGASESPFPAPTRTVVETNNNNLTEVLANNPNVLVVRVKGQMDISLPPASQYPGKIISINNETGGNVDYASGTLASLTTTMRVASAHLLWSDGTGWWCLSSRNG